MQNFFYQHVGEEMARRDFPRSIGTPRDGLVEFSLDELYSWNVLSAENERFLKNTARPRSTETFQIWGVPDGAERVFQNAGFGDEFMLMGSHVFEVIGTILLKLPEFDFNLSKAIWREERFPIIVFLQNTKFISLHFDDFRKKLNFAPNYHMRGYAMRVAPARLRDAGFADGRDLGSWCRAHPATS